MKEISDKNVPSNEVLNNPFNQETNSQDLFDFITSHECEKANELYDETIKGRKDLIWKPVPGYSDQQILLPRDVSPNFFEIERKKRVEEWVGMKKKAVNRLLDLDTDSAVNLLGTFCGYGVNIHIRKGLLHKDPGYRSLIEQEIEKCADKIDLSKNIITRKLQEIKLQEQIMNSKDHLDWIAKYKYYFDLKELLSENYSYKN